MRHGVTTLGLNVGGSCLPVICGICIGITPGLTGAMVCRKSGLQKLMKPQRILFSFSQVVYHLLELTHHIWPDSAREPRLTTASLRIMLDDAILCW